MRSRARERRTVTDERAIGARRLAASAAVLLALLLAPPASAKWARVSAVPTDSKPYVACPPGGPDRLQCQLIVDPPIKRAVRGPVPAGAVTAGPVQETSPALSGSGVGGGYSPADLRAAYDLPSDTAGAGQTIAIVDAYDDPNAEQDLATYRAEYGLGECTTENGCFRKVDQTGGTNFPAPNNIWATEISLDLDMVSAICPKCHLLLVEAKNDSRANLAAAEEQAAALGADEISNSFGGAGLKSPFASSYEHPGIPTTAAGGDEGYGTEFPADTPGVIAVGGTTLKPAANTRGWTETAWSEGGSGCGEEPKPIWQSDSGCPYRTANDIAAIGDPNTPVSVYDSYNAVGWRNLAGTSAATPIVAAAMALADDYTKSLPGAAALYLDAEQLGEGAFNDVVAGSNGNCLDYLCQAGPGYDGPTGLGTLDGTPQAQQTVAAQTGSASSITQTSATLSGTVNPAGEEVTYCRFEYGTSQAYGSSAGCKSLPGSGEAPVVVSALAKGLAQATTYHFRLVAAAGPAFAYGSDQTFTTSIPKPTVRTEPASSITYESATLAGSVNPNGWAVSDCRLEYGPTQSLGSSAPCVPSPGSGSSEVSVSALAAGLDGGTLYYFRISATNGGGPSYGALRELTTPPGPPRLVAEAPSDVTGSSATLHGTVSAHGQTVGACAFEYEAIEPFVHGGRTTPCSPPSIPSNGSVSVAAPASGLFEGITYSLWLRLTTTMGDQFLGAPTEFTVPPVPTGPRPTVTKISAKKGPAAGGTSVTITGTHLAEATSVWFGATKAASFTGGSDSSITAVTPASSSGKAMVRVTTASGGTSFGATKANFTFDAPTITSVSPGSGPVHGGTTVTVSGSGFATGGPGTGETTLFAFGKVGATGNCSSSVLCTVVSPDSGQGKTKSVAVRAVVGKASKKTPADVFTYTAG
jgi:hypothetical protein